MNVHNRNSAASAASTQAAPDANESVKQHATGGGANGRGGHAYRNEKHAAPAASATTASDELSREQNSAAPAATSICCGERA